MVSDAKIRKAKPQDRARTDRRGKLIAFIMAAGSELWRFRYRFSRQEKLLSFGHYDEMALRTPAPSAAAVARSPVKRIVRSLPALQAPWRAGRCPARGWRRPGSGHGCRRLRDANELCHGAALCGVMQLRLWRVRRFPGGRRNLPACCD
jgi:hypothetical protein